MPYGIIQPKTWESQSSTLPSPQVWGDGLNDEARQLGTGYFVAEDWKHTPSTSTLLPTIGNNAGGTTATSVPYSLDYLYLSTAGGPFLRMLTGSTTVVTTNQNIVYFQPLGIPVLTSQNKLKMEAIIAFNQTVSTNLGVFVGFADYQTISTGNVFSTLNSTTHSSNIPVIGNQVGFLIGADNDQYADAVFQSTNIGSAAGGLVVVAGSTNVSNAFNNTLQPQNQGAGTGTGGVFPVSTLLAASTFYKFGVTFDGTANAWTWYFNGVQVAKQSAIGSTNTSTQYAPVIAFASQNATASTIDVAYFAGGYAPAA